MWLVLHIPKTAGTSLRWSLENSFGKSGVIRDYGPNAKETSKVVQEHLYDGDESKGPKTLITTMTNNKKRILIGHFHLQKYADFFEAQNIIVFVRDPLIRMCSEYLHRIQNGTVTGTFSEFVQEPGFQNSQSGYIRDISEEAFIGVTEQYQQSLEYLNRTTQWNLSIRKKNVARHGGGQKFAENLSRHELDLFYKMNAEDMGLYQFVIRRFAACKTSEPTGANFIDWKKRNNQA